MFSPNSALLATVDAEGRTEIRDGHTGQVQATLDLVVGMARSHVLAFSPDSTKLATSSAADPDPAFRLWDTSTGRLIHEFKGHHYAVTSIAFSSDGSRLLSTSKDNTAHIWDLRSLSLFRTLKGHTANVTGGVFSPDGEHVVTFANDRYARLYDVRSGQLRQAISGNVRAAAFSPDGVFLAIVGKEGMAGIWDGKTGAKISELSGHAETVTHVFFVPDGDQGPQIVTSSKDGTIRIFSAEDWTLVRALRSYAQIKFITAIRGSLLLSISEPTVSNKHEVRTWNIGEYYKIQTLRHHLDEIYSVSFSSDGAHAITASVDHTAIVWNVRTGTYELSLQHLNDVTSASFSLDGKTQITTSHQNVRLWQGGKLVEPLIKTDQILSAAVMSPNNQYIATLGLSGGSRTQIYDVNTGKLLRTIDGKSGVSAVAFSPDSKFIATGEMGGTIRLWTIGGEPISTLQRHTGTINALAFSKNGLSLASAGEDGKVCLWCASESVRSPWQVRELQGHRSAVRAVAFVPDMTGMLALGSSVIVSASQDGSVRYWGVESGELMFELPLGIGHHQRGKAIKSASISTDGKYVLMAPWDKVARIYAVPTMKAAFDYANRLLKQP
jgi:WD40 repeat protein